MISAAVLTHDDEKNLPRTLAGIDFCDEIIIVDDYSTDATCDIARKYTKKLYRRHLDSDFSAQRNFGLSKATGDWVLFVDSDEVVSPELATEIKEKVVRQKNGYYLKRRDFFWGRWLKYGETGNIRLLRLAKKGAGVWRRPVHEAWQIKGEIGELSSPLLHYPHSNVAQFLEEINRYSTLNAQYLKSLGVKVYWWHILAYPAAKFFVNYFFRLGFLDGMPGMILAIMMSFHSFLTRAKLYLLGRQHA